MNFTLQYILCLFVQILFDVCYSNYIGTPFTAISNPRMNQHYAV